MDTAALKMPDHIKGLCSPRRGHLGVPAGPPAAEPPGGAWAPPVFVPVPLLTLPKIKIPAITGPRRADTANTEEQAVPLMPPGTFAPMTEHGRRAKRSFSLRSLKLWVLEKNGLGFHISLQFLEGLTSLKLGGVGGALR